MDVLNIPVGPTLMDRWRGWLAPARHPLFLTSGEAETLGLHTVARGSVTMAPEERDTFTVWNVSPGATRVAWLTSQDVDALTPRARREVLRVQVRHGRGNVPLGRRFADLRPDLPASRFLWRRDQLTDAVLARVVAAGGQACRRNDVPETVWTLGADRLPLARLLAGTFPTGAGNCFGTVMGAAGIPGAADEWMQREPFEAFLSGHAAPLRRSCGADDRPGTVLVWRSADGLVQHAAVTLGNGWALHKASQTWWTPRVVLPLGVLKAAARSPGWRLSRVTLR